MGGETIVELLFGQEIVPCFLPSKSKKRSTGERGILPALITGAVGSTHPVAPTKIEFTIYC
jgi:hypothetical protein